MVLNRVYESCEHPSGNRLFPDFLWIENKFRMSTKKDGRIYAAHQGSSRCLEQRESRREFSFALLIQQWFFFFFFFFS